MPRRVSVPGADELFRPTAGPGQDDAPHAPREPADAAAEAGAGPAAGAPGPTPGRAPSGRVRHDEKMTVYVTSDELLELEHARLTLRRAGVSVDRGRLVREAVALALADLERNGTDSEIAHRLTDA